MPTYCRTCGRLIEEGGDICDVCKENIRAEAMGRQRKIAKEAPKEAAKLRMRARKGVKDKTSPPTSHNENGEKKPHHFKSMAEYLDYLKRKE
jgi:hypothetical protein